MFHMPFIIFIQPSFLYVSFAFLSHYYKHIFYNKLFTNPHFSYWFYPASLFLHQLSHTYYNCVLFHCTRLSLNTNYSRVFLSPTMSIHLQHSPSSSWAHSHWLQYCRLSIYKDICHYKLCTSLFLLILCLSTSNILSPPAQSQYTGISVTTNHARLFFYYYVNISPVFSLFQLSHIFFLCFEGDSGWRKGVDIEICYVWDDGYVSGGNASLEELLPYITNIEPHVTYAIHPQKCYYCHMF